MLQQRPETGLSDDELRGMTDAFRGRFAEGETLDDLLPEAFAVVREASKRVLEQRHYDVQLMGGGALHLGGRQSREGSRRSRQCHHDA